MVLRIIQKGEAPDQLPILLQKLLSFKSPLEKKVGKKKRKQAMTVENFPESDYVLNHTLSDILIYKCEQKIDQIECTTI